MTRQTDDSDDAASSIRIPSKFVVAFIGAVLFGGMGINTALFKAAPSEELGEILKIVATNTAHVSDNGNRITSLDAKVEALRADLLSRTASRFTQEDAAKLEREQDQKHEALEKADAQAQRAIAALERELDQYRQQQGVRK